MSALSRALCTVLRTVLLMSALSALPTIAAETSSTDQTTGSEVKSLDALLQLIKTAKLQESKEHRQRERAFKADKDRQAQLLQQAQQQKAEEEARSAQLESTFSDNERELDLLREQMENRLGTLKELFGHITATAGDTVTRLEKSLVSAQYPGRTVQLNELIEKMSSNSRLPSLEEIENLAYEMSREMVESGRVSRFNTTVLSADGTQSEQEVIRIGLFNLVSNGRYLNYNSDSGVLAELARQPRGLSKGAVELQSASTGFTPASIDPSGPAGGGLLRALVDRPGPVEKWHQGGLVGYGGRLSCEVSLRVCVGNYSKTSIRLITHWGACSAWPMPMRASTQSRWS